MIKFNNLNNLSAYLKKTEAEEIYMKKINSINLSFTTLLNSITSKFHEYDNKIFNCQLSIHSNSTDIASLDSIIGSIESNTNSMYLEVQDMSDILTAYTDNYETYTNEIANELYSISSNTSMLYDSLTNMTFPTQAEAYNYWKEFGKYTQLSYADYQNNNTVLDNEQFTYTDNISNFSIESNKGSYVFCSNVLTQNSFNFNYELDRLGLVPGNDNCNPIGTAINFDVKLNDTISSFTFSGKYLTVSFYNDNSINNFNYLMWKGATNPLIDFTHFKPNANTLHITASRAATIQNLNNKWIDYHNKNYKATFENCSGISFVFDSNRNSQGLDSYFGMMTFDNSVLLSVKNDFTPTSLYMVGDLRIPSIKIYNDKCIKFGWGNFSSDVNIFNYGTLDTNTLERFTSRPGNFDTYQNFTVSNIGNSTFTQNSFCISCMNILTNLKLYDFQNLTFSLATGNYLSFSDSKQNYNNISFNRCSFTNVDMVVNLNSILNLSGISCNEFKASLKGENHGLMCNNLTASKLYLTGNNSPTIYSFKNPTATVDLGLGKLKIDYMTADKLNVEGGVSVDVGVFNSIYWNGRNGYALYGPWKYVWFNDITLQNEDLIFGSMLKYDSAFFHTPINLSYQGINNAMNNPEVELTHKNVFVDNAITTTLNLRLTGNNTSKQIDVDWINNQKSIVGVDCRGWKSSNIIGFGKPSKYLFNLIASDRGAEVVNFSMTVDDTNEWEPYKEYFNPFGNHNVARIELCETI
jgi:hypothetical protein